LIECEKEHLVRGRLLVPSVFYCWTTNLGI